MSKFEQPRVSEGEPEDIKEEETEPTEERISEEPETAPELEAKEELSPEVQKEAEGCDKELAETIESQLKEGELTPEQANEILQRAEELDPKQKAEVMRELEREAGMTPEELEEKEKVSREFQEAISGYEEAVDNLVERANALGIEVSSEKLHSFLEQLQNIEPEPNEEMEELKYFDEQLKELSGLIERMEKARPEKKKGEPVPEEAKKDFTKIFEELTTKMVEYSIRLAGRIIKGIIKGVIRAFRRGETVERG